MNFKLFETVCQLTWLRQLQLGVEWEVSEWLVHLSQLKRLTKLEVCGEVVQDVGRELYHWKLVDTMVSSLI